MSVFFCFFGVQFREGLCGTVSFEILPEMHVYKLPVVGFWAPCVYYMELSKTWGIHRFLYEWYLQALTLYKVLNEYHCWKVG